MPREVNFGHHHMPAAFSFYGVDFRSQQIKHDFDARGWLRVNCATITFILATLEKVSPMCQCIKGSASADTRTEIKTAVKLLHVLSRLFEIFINNRTCTDYICTQPIVEFYFYISQLQDSKPIEHFLF